MDARQCHRRRRRDLDHGIQGHRPCQQGPVPHPAERRQRIPPYAALQGRTSRPAGLPPLRDGAHLRRIVRLGRRRGQSQGDSLCEELRHSGHSVQFARQGVRIHHRRPDRSREVPRRGCDPAAGGARQRYGRLHEQPHHPFQPLRRQGAAGPRILDDERSGKGRGLRAGGHRQRQIPAENDRRGLEQSRNGYA